VIYSSTKNYLTIIYTWDNTCMAYTSLIYEACHFRFLNVTIFLTYLIKTKKSLKEKGAMG